MKKLIVSVVAVSLLVGSSLPSYASDWDKAGKALAIIEGVRILTGGKVDVVGRITGINSEHPTAQYSHQHRKPAKVQTCSKVWVPHYVWREVYVPEHEEYSQDYGYVIVESHYIRYQVEDGGNWVYQNCYHKNYGQQKKYHH